MASNMARSPDNDPADRIRGQIESLKGGDLTGSQWPSPRTVRANVVTPLMAAKASKATDSRQLALREQGGEAYVTPPNPDSPPPVPPLPGRASCDVAFDTTFRCHDFVQSRHPISPRSATVARICRTPSSI
ncbi:MAG: hypothetical protein WBV46_05345 [Terriglobales bacterium]|jgi:hypothetical protein